MFPMLLTKFPEDVRVSANRQRRQRHIFSSIHSFKFHIVVDSHVLGSSILVLDEHHRMG